MSRDNFYPHHTLALPVLPEDGQVAARRQRSHSPQKNSPSVTKKRTNGRTKRHRESHFRRSESLNARATPWVRPRQFRNLTQIPLFRTHQLTHRSTTPPSTFPEPIQTTRASRRGRLDARTHVAAAIAFFEGPQGRTSAQQSGSAPGRSHVVTDAVPMPPKSGE